MLQLLFLIIVIYFLVAFSLAAADKWTINSAAWTAFVTIFATLAIAGTPKWIAELLAQRDGVKIPPDKTQNKNNIEEEKG